MANSDARVDLSLVVPMYNEAEVVDHFFGRIAAVMETVHASYEIVCINDGSSDTTLQQLRDHAARDPRIKVIDLSRNFGKEQALTAGLDFCTGRAVIPIDADLQDPPELISAFVAKWREGYHVVYGVRGSRQADGLVKRTTALAFYRLFNAITDVQIPHNTGDFRLMDRRAVDALQLLPERNRFMKGLFAWVGFKQIGVPFQRDPRFAGTTKFNYWRLWNFALDGITAFSTTPLRIWSYIGFSVSILAFLYALFIVTRTLIYGIDAPGYASLMTVVLFLGGIQLLTLGILGEYLGRLMNEVKGRPTYIVNEVVGFDEDQQRDQRRQNRWR